MSQGSETLSTQASSELDPDEIPANNTGESTDTKRGATTFLIPFTRKVPPHTTTAPRSSSSPSVSPRISGGTCIGQVVQSQGADVAPIAPPNAGYYVTLTCPPDAFPSFIQTRIFTSNINSLDPETPGTTGYTLIRSEPRFNCLGNSCRTPNYSYAITATQYFRVESQAQVNTPQGPLFTNIAYTIKPYNNNGVMYPQIASSKFQNFGTSGNGGLSPVGLVPFPSRFPNRPAYTSCDTTGLPGRCLRRTAASQTQFRGNSQRQYNQNNWVIPDAPWAHHIRPIEFGGDNTVDLQNIPPANRGGSTDNAVILRSSDHINMNRWWSAFTP